MVLVLSNMQRLQEWQGKVRHVLAFHFSRVTSVIPCESKGPTTPPLVAESDSVQRNSRPGWTRHTCPSTFFTYGMPAAPASRSRTK
jgi:hypothetical protein